MLITFPFVVYCCHSIAQTDSTVKKCNECHGKIIAQEVIHPATETCDKCHQSNGQPHPLENVMGFSMAATVPELCYNCHDPKNTKKNIHSPVVEGKCLTCHTPHSSPEFFLLKQYPPSMVCKECHDLKGTEKKVTHPPVAEGKCNKCHNPHQSDEDHFLKSETSRLCIKCHKKQGEELKDGNVHPPFRNNCALCHKPHGSNENKLLDMSPPELCFYCHDDMKNKVEKSSTVHGAVTENKGCVNCHSPHASAQPMFLHNEPKELCLNCHNKTMTSGNRTISNINELLQKGKSVHEAINKNGCIACHDPHASSNSKLLIKPMPEGSYAPASDENFALCFTCHKSELIENEISVSTGFRNGDKNLHFVHIHGKKGRSCNICHNPHGSLNDHLIKEKTKFGSWEMPMNYKSSESGGSCLPGCHVERKYER
ncbi:MAG: hypothetical protein HYY40_08335 [Bacteroidetes bacterium]|nr:hypothetical protein [Bacteroidota bacterium]